MTDLFAPRSPDRPQTPRQAAVDPRLHLCHCGVFGAFGYGAAWFCKQHRPAGFMPSERGDG